jgi:endonuclease/exonuclease/phosphatase family metal-dependent hydrolase
VRRLLPLMVLAALTACAAAKVNYTDPAGPRFAGGVATSPEEETALRVASLNISMGSHLPEVIALLQSSSELELADLVLLQEVDSVSVRTIADALEMAWVYYPATLHPKSQRDYGNAVLSRHPILADQKIPLPYLARGRRTARAAVAATVEVHGQPMRVYSLHLATVIGNTPSQRYEQLRTVLSDADRYPAAIIGGDFNDEAVPELALPHGFSWPTRNLPATNAFWTFDHILVKGLPRIRTASTGVVRDTLGASDHRPVWLELALVPQASTPLAGAAGGPVPTGP